MESAPGSSPEARLVRRSWAAGVAGVGILSWLLRLGWLEAALSPEMENDIRPPIPSAEMLATRTAPAAEILCELDLVGHLRVEMVD